MNSKSLNNSFKFLFESKKFADMTFVIHGEELEAHKIVVASRSPVFEAMITNDLAPKDGKHLINDPSINYADFENFLQFLYTDDCLITEDNVEKLMHLGNFYNVGFLIEKCVEKIEVSLHLKNLLKFAELGILYENTCSLLQNCLSKIPDFFLGPSFTYLTEKGFKRISSNLALKIAEKCPRTENFTEDVLFKKIFDWATEGKPENEKSKEVQETLKPFIPFFKFENFDPLTLATFVRDNHLLDAEHLLDAISKATIESNKKYSLKVMVREGLKKQRHHKPYELPWQKRFKTFSKPF